MPGRRHDDDDTFSEDEETPLEPKLLPLRHTRGTRLSKLIGEAAEADEEFWGQSAWQELSEDDDILSDEYNSDERRDIEDSDFDDADENEDEGEAEEPEKRRRPTKRARSGVYVDPALRTTRKRRVPTDPGSRKRARAVPSAVTRTFRQSTSHKTATAALAREAAATLRAERNNSRPKRNIEVVRMTQQELLEEAARTEVENRLSLKAMLTLQEERRHVALQREQDCGPRVRFISKAGSSPTLTFTGVGAVPTMINQHAPDYPAQPVCSISGLRAKYRDPQTGLPYATLAAFTMIRNRSKSGKSCRKNKNSTTSEHRKKVIRAKVATKPPIITAGVAPSEYAANTVAVGNNEPKITDDGAVAPPALPAVDASVNTNEEVKTSAMG